MPVAYVGGGLVLVLVGGEEEEVIIPCAPRLGGCGKEGAGGGYRIAGRAGARELFQTSGVAVDGGVAAPAGFVSGYLVKGAARRRRRDGLPAVGAAAVAGWTHCVSTLRTAVLG
jgi:hypothetical protein